ncbi:hypothetical protein Clacol_003466 [Clathrus columnatus]|uniref:Uncharacterized protein n=1 Tax=Clathrus columnatus TaxID=1419009 RepID=A0AAV5A7L9_9AGAM|nr:hypothetical protein Clacol_003466 [Clathrus columnatus]
MPRLLLVSDYKTTSNAVYLTDSKTVMKGDQLQITKLLITMRRDAQGVWSDWEEVGEVDRSNRVWPGGIPDSAPEGRAELQERAALAKKIASEQKALENALARAAVEKAALDHKVALEKKAALKEKQHPKKKQHQSKKPFDKCPTETVILSDTIPVAV